ncbi:Protein MAO HUZI 4 [Durusdinium trenchii]|uniref:Chloroplastic n=1 Tax=Durusdinium trenchii TaxID=1381693 RepID=A0ABP0JGI4_9DINO
MQTCKRPTQYLLALSRIQSILMSTLWPPTCGQLAETALMKEAGSLSALSGPQEAMMNLMRSPGFVSEEWSHVLAWDLFVGRWIYLDGQRRGIFASHSVLFCNLIGPPGLLMHAITCLVLGKGLPQEEPLKNSDA